jgi:hypothetical protein
MAKEFIRQQRGELSLDEFIHHETKDRLIISESEPLNEWIQNQAPSNGKAFLSAKNPLVKGLTLNHPFGYIENTIGDTSVYLSFERLNSDELGGKNIPSDLRFPFRSLASMCFVIFGILFFYNHVTKDKKDLFINSSAMLGVKIGLFLLMGGMSLIAMPFLYGWMNDKPPFIFLGGFIVMSGIVTLSLFGYQMAFMSKLLREENIWAHWTYDRDEWQEATAKTYNIEKAEKTGLFILITILFILVWAGFGLFVDDATAGIMALMFLGILALLAVFAFVLPFFTYIRKMERPGEILISKDGVYNCGTVHTWFLAGARLEKVNRLKKPFQMLEFVYSYVMMAGRIPYFFRNSYALRVPIPAGKETEADHILSQFQKLLTI